ncbi:SDR family NAD(P)-dependent oxidoreductase [Burkholderia anthina]|uniref:SDR family NAD(P)-dependent oxidoreductase n=1 Tax=Burkholderia anthina TaxID=179879 RepID=UPI00158AD18F|nr:SDR family NAD(P)-dependent oxidoreductase [Burkholderia anthina]
MLSSQLPINSGFGRLTTAQEVLEGKDLSGKTVIVTGGHSGIGLETTRALAGAGARVIVGARRLAPARAAVDRLERVETRELDLTDMLSVRRFAKAFLDSGIRADIVINSAGVMACPETRVGAGWEAQFATNHLGHYALVNLLWPALVEGARVIAVSSAGHHYSGIRWDDVQFGLGYDKWLAYAQSKTANALFAVHLDALGRERGVRAFSLHPGSIATPLQRHISIEEMIALGWADEAGNPANPDALKTPQQGAATQVWAATSPQLDGMGGLYCEDCDIARIASDNDNTLTGVRKHAVDPDQAQLLWGLSARLTGIDAFAA